MAAHTVPFPFLFEAFRPSGSLWRVKPTPAAHAADTIRRLAPLLRSRGFEFGTLCR